MQRNNIFLVISAPSGTGKTTIINRILSEDDRLEFVISTTSRKSRKGEIESGCYHFIAEEEFRRRIENDEFIEWSLVHGSYYGITKEEFDRVRDIGRIPIFDIDVQGAKKLKVRLEGAVFIFVIPPSIEVLKERLFVRGTDSEEETRIRLNNVKNELKEFDNYDYIIINDSIDDAVEDLKAILRAELCKNKAKALRILEMLEVDCDSSSR